jgi:hypothetical protein
LVHDLTPDGEEIQNVDAAEKGIERLFKVILRVAFFEISEAATIAVVTKVQRVSNGMTLILGKPETYLITSAVKAAKAYSSLTIVPVSFASRNRWANLLVFSWRIGSRFVTDCFEKKLFRILRRTR